MENINNKSWLCINKYLPELDINNIKETLLKSGVTFFNLHRMEKGYFPTSLIKFQVDTNKTDLSDLHNKNIKIENRDYIIRKYTEKPRQDYRYRYANFAEKPRRYVKPHPSTRYIKETAEKTNIEQYTNYQKTLAEYTRRLELIQEELSKLKNTLHDLAEEKKKRLRLKDHELTIKIETALISQLQKSHEKSRIKQINAIANKLTRKLQLDETKSEIANSIIERTFRLLGIVNLPPNMTPDEIIQSKYHIIGLDKGP